MFLPIVGLKWSTNLNLCEIWQDYDAGLEDPSKKTPSAKGNIVKNYSLVYLSFLNFANSFPNVSSPFYCHFLDAQIFVKLCEKKCSLNECVSFRNTIMQQIQLCHKTKKSFVTCCLRLKINFFVAWRYPSNNTCTNLKGCSSSKGKMYLDRHYCLQTSFPCLPSCPTIIIHFGFITGKYFYEGWCTRNSSLFNL